MNGEGRSCFQKKKECWSHKIIGVFKIEKQNKNKNPGSMTSLIVSFLTCKMVIYTGNYYRHTSFNCTSQILHFLQIKGLWQPCIVRQLLAFFSKKVFCFLFFLAVLGLCCCTLAFSSCGSRGYSSLWCVGFSLRWLLLLRSMGSRHAGFSSCGTWVQ